MRIFLLSFVVTIALVGCTRTPGEGGIATVTGTVELEQRIVITNPANAVVVPAADEDVFITYGDRVGPDDRVQTNFDGAFAFYELRPGAYTVYVYSEDTSGVNPPRDMAVVQHLTIASAKETVVLDTLRIFKDL